MKFYINFTLISQLLFFTIILFQKKNIDQFYLEIKKCKFLKISKNYVKLLKFINFYVILQHFFEILKNTILDLF